MTDPRLAQLAKYLTDVESTTTQADFWAGWDGVAGDLCQQVWAGGAVEFPVFSGHLIDGVR